MECREIQREQNLFKTEREKDNGAAFYDLPFELILECFSYLDVKSLARVELTCRAWRVLCEETSLWEKLFQRDFPILSSFVEEEPLTKKLYFFVSHLIPLLPLNETFLPYTLNDSKLPAMDEIGNFLAVVKFPFCKQDIIVFDHVMNILDPKYFKIPSITDLQYNESESLYYNPSQVESIKVTDQNIIVGSYGTLSFFQKDNFEKIMQIDCPQSKICALATYGKTIIAGFPEGTLLVITADLKTSYLLGHQHRITHLFTQNNKLISSDFEGNLKIWDLQTLNIEKEFKYKTIDSVNYFSLYTKIKEDLLITSFLVDIKMITGENSSKFTYVSAISVKKWESLKTLNEFYLPFCVSCFEVINNLIFIFALEDSTSLNKGELQVWDLQKGVRLYSLPLNDCLIQLQKIGTTLYGFSAHKMYSWEF